MIEELIREPEKMAIVIVGLWVLPLIAYLVDFWTGVEGAKAQGEKIHSSRLRKTFVKIGEYWRIQVMAVLIDVVCFLLPFYELPYFSMIATLSIVIIEGRSIRENFAKKKSGVVDAIALTDDLIKKIMTTTDEKTAKIIAENLFKHLKK